VQVDADVDLADNNVAEIPESFDVTAIRGGSSGQLKQAISSPFAMERRLVRDVGSDKKMLATRGPH
jgi:hypothetical protein